MNNSRLQGASFVLLAMALAVSLGAATQVAAQAGDPPAGPAAPQANLGTGFTYQGQLNTNGAPVNATCDMGFSLWNALAGPAQVGAPQLVNPVQVVNGRFTVVLNDAGQMGSNLFTGAALWLQVALRCPAGVGAPTILAPRQPLTAAPYALSLMPGAVISSTAATNSGAGLKVVSTISTSVGIWGENGPGSGIGVPVAAIRGDSRDHYGVEGVSQTTTGVYGISGTSYGVVGFGGGGGVQGGTLDPTGAAAGVRASGSGDPGPTIALAIANGGIQVEDAGVNSQTPVFIHQVDTGGDGNVCTGHTWASVIDYPLINGNDDAILIVTPNNGPYIGGVTPVNSVPAVFYDNADFCGPGPDKWVIYTLDQATALPNNAMYNVLVVVP